MTTKEQERRAIEKIKKIMEELGENSYVGFAMEGVLELAEDNIRDDAAYSMKGQAEIAEKRQEAAEAENKKMKGLLEKAQKTTEDLRVKLNKTQYMAQQWNMPQQIREQFVQIVSEEQERAAIRMTDAADSMANSIGESGNFSAFAADAAGEYKKQRKRKETCENLLRTLDRYKE